MARARRSRPQDRARFARRARARRAALLRDKAHDLGNLVQIIRIASMEIERRADARIAELVADLRRAAEQATAVLAALVVARPAEQRAARRGGAPTLRAAIERIRPAITAPIELVVQVGEHVVTTCSAAELETIAIAGLLDVAAATRVALMVRGARSRARRGSS